MYCDKFLYSIKTILYNRTFVLFTWFIIPLITGVKHAILGVFNDYRIFKSVFYNTIEQINLYFPYPELNGDSNHYGPIFSIVFAPFALLPDGVGTILWEFLMAAVLFVAIDKLPIEWKSKVMIFYICLVSLFANSVNSETNSLIAALIIGSFICFRKEKDFWAACFIALGMFIKLYGVVGLAFFFFSRHKIKFCFSFAFWCLVFITLPMLISSPEFIVQSYVDWYESLVFKNELNIGSLNQDLSVMGMTRRISGNFSIPNLPILVCGLILFALQYINISQYKDLRYQLGILASTLMFVVLFSTGTENCTFIIATCGAGMWFILQERPFNKYLIALIGCVVLFQFLASGMSPTWIRKGIMRAYALQALPYFMVWLLLVYQIIRFGKTPKIPLSSESLEASKLEC